MSPAVAREVSSEDLPRAPRVSVCIPTYRGEAYLAAAIDSVLAQTFRDFELVVIDDNSPDSTADIVRNYADPRIVYLRNDTNRGPKGNWNRCLEVARGHYFKLLPHDDLIYPGCLESQIAVLDADPDERIALVFSARNVIGPSGRVLMRRGYPAGKSRQIKAVDLIRSCVRRGTNLLGEPGAVMCRRSLTTRVGGFDASNPYVIDLDYWFRLLAHGDAYFDTMELAAFRVSTQSWSVAIGDGQRRDFSAFLTRLRRCNQLPVSGFDLLCSRFTPLINNLARLVFYRLYLS